jgi:hypothetical protein
MAVVACPKCRLPIALPEDAPGRQVAACGKCRKTFDIQAFPALWHGHLFGTPGEAVLTAEECSCFYHPAKRAVRSCESCGRFLCALCEVEIGDAHLCPACIASGRREKKMHAVENRRVLYDNIALAVAVLPLITIYFTLITAPIAIFISIRYWNAPTSILGRGKWRFVVAILVSLLELGLWALFFVALFGGML